MSNDKTERDDEMDPRGEVRQERRSLLGSTGAGAAAAVLGLLAVACGDDDDVATSMNNPSASSSGQGGAGAGGAGGAGQGGAGGGTDADITPLNALLNAEYLAVTAYTAGAGLIAAATDTDPLKGLADVITAVAVDFQSQHKLHAEALAEQIIALGGTPLVEADVAATFEPPQALLDAPTISNVLKYAAGAERNAAVAYNQVIGSLEAAQLRFLASAIEGDETQHFIVLAALVLGLAGPGPELNTTTAADVVPQAFVAKVGDQPGLDSAPPDYFP
ncbi:MAG: ferritin-like domain-containing protein [Polyangiaceae bacterium]